MRKILSLGLLLPLTSLSACGVPVVRGRAPSASVSSASVGRRTTCDAEVALELEAIHEARTAPGELSAVLRAERAILEHRRGGVFAEVEADAAARVAAAEHLGAMLSEDTISAQESLARLRAGCSAAKLAAASKARPPWATKATAACERAAQLGIAWTDARSVSTFADELDKLGGFVDAGPQRQAVKAARRLVVALRATSADRAVLDAPQDAAARVERDVPPCSSAPHALPPPLVVAKDPSPRALTVVVVAKTPGVLADQLEEAARATEDAAFASLLRGVASGRLGSGFVVVAGGGTKWVVTNRHVVDLAGPVSIVLEDGASLEASPVYVDAGYDLAVLAPKDPAGRLAPRGGFQLTARAARDGEAVTATGYPALLGAPSFQLTKGHVSNQHIMFPDGTSLPHVQHTAAIDPGSSGGPLLGPAREVLGVNTFKLVGRENVNVAVPGGAVVSALDRAGRAMRCDERCRVRLAKDACLALTSELGRAQPRLASLQRALGRDLVAAHGIASHDSLARADSEIFARFRASPVATLSEAVARRLAADVAGSGGIHPLETCSDLAPGADQTRATLSLADGQRRAVTLRWEFGRWVLADYAFPTEAIEPPAKASTTTNRKTNR